MLPDQPQDDAPSGRPDRRTLLKAAAVTGGAVWAAPAIMTLDAAAASTCCTAATGPVQLITVCQVNANQNDETCQEKTTGTGTVCRQRNQQMLFSRDQLGTQSPYVDDLVVLTVIPPPTSGGITQVQNFTAFSITCEDPNSTLPDFPVVSANPCGTTTVPAIDITPMFGEICGLFTVTASVRNDVDPYAWSTMWIYPV